VLYPRHRLDISAAQLAFAAAACIWSRRPDAREHALELELGDEALVCFSVRSGFELLLDALDWPPGSEILVSALTHPDLADIARRHGLTFVPIDVDSDTLAPRIDLLERSLTPRTRAVLVAHLFGSRTDLTPVAKIASGHGLLLLEDAAQSYLGPGDSGDPQAAVSMFSFGTIKTAPALGGAILYVRDPDLLARMCTLRIAWPRQSRSEYTARVLRIAGLQALAEPHVYGAFARVSALAGRDVDAMVNRSTHGLKPPAGDRDRAFVQWARRRPSAPLLAVLARRLRGFDRGRLARRAERGDRLAGSIPPGLRHPGRSAGTRTHWVFPVCVSNPRALIEHLRRAGFDATQATTSIAAISAPPNHPEATARAAQHLITTAVFIPVYPEMPERIVLELIDALSTFEHTAAQERRDA
jgi:perosamine synthetase